MQEHKTLDERLAISETLLERRGNAAPKKSECDQAMEAYRKFDASLHSEPELNADTFGSFVRNLQETIEGELELRVFLSVDPQHIGLYEEQAPFGHDVAIAFPSALTDSQEAAKCYALDRPTACVFHLMRVTEFGLRALEKHLSLSRSPNWGQALSQIEKTLNQQPDGFHRDCLAYLQAIKLAWRNPTMHVERSYSIAEAEKVFNTVDVFMRHLARRISG